MHDTPEHTSNAVNPVGSCKMPSDLKHHPTPFVKSFFNSAEGTGHNEFVACEQALLGVGGPPLTPKRACSQANKFVAKKTHLVWGGWGGGDGY